MDQEDCASMAPSADEEEQEERKKKIDEALSLLGSYHARCSEMLGAAARGRRRVMADLELRCLAFLEQELSCLTVLTPRHVVDEGMLAWLQELVGTVSETLPHALKQAAADDPQRLQTLLRRAVKSFFRCSRHHSSSQRLRSAAERLYRLVEDPCRYRPHLVTAAFSRLSSQPFPVALGDRCSSWFERSPPPSYDFPYDIDLLTLYVAMMCPYGYKFDKDRLVMKWLCEGVVVNNLETWFHYISEAKADCYFSHLVDMNVIVTTDNHNNPDEAEAWKWNVDHLQHQFLASKSAEMGFVFTSATLNFVAASSATATDHGNEAIIPSRTPRRLAFHNDDPNIPSLLQTMDLSQTRSLAVSGAASGVPVDQFINLVVLDVEGWENFEDEDLLRVCRGKMFFLVYLNIRKTRVTKLPPEIKELSNLKVLDASYTQVADLPLGLFEAKRLHRLDLRGTPIRQLTLPKQSIGLHHSLLALLLGGEETINSNGTAVQVPHDIRCFSRLETLATIDLSEQPASFVKALGDLEYLRVLAITWSFHQSSDPDYCEALLSSIRRWSLRLKSITIHCELGCSMGFLCCLSHSYLPLNLETFKVTVGKFGGMPQWFHKLRYLSFVKITVCKLEAHDLVILRDLARLKCLMLGLDFIPTEAIVITNNGFHKLRRFYIDCPMPWLSFESGAMQHLTYLQLNFCTCPTRPISVPLGISNLSCLTEVGLYYNVKYANSYSVKMTVDAVRKEFAKRRNTTHMTSLFINNIKQDDVQAVDEDIQFATRAPSGTDSRAKDDVQASDEKTTEVTQFEITEAEN